MVSSMYLWQLCYTVQLPDGTAHDCIAPGELPTMSHNTDFLAELFLYLPSTKSEAETVERVVTTLNNTYNLMTASVRGHGLPLVDAQVAALSRLTMAVSSRGTLADGPGCCVVCSSTASGCCRIACWCDLRLGRDPHRPSAGLHLGWSEPGGLSPRIERLRLILQL